MTSDVERCARLRAGDSSVVQELLDRGYGAVVFFAHVVGVPEPERVAAQVWERVLTDIVNGEIKEDIRVALLSGVSAAAETETGAVAPNRYTPGRLGSFLEKDPRWEGWWSVEPPEWPPGTQPAPAQVAAAVRCLPLAWRTVLVLRDIVGLTAEEAATVRPEIRPNQATTVESARDAYLVELDREVSGATEVVPVGQRVVDRPSSGIRAVDARCDDVADLVMRWQKGTMRERDRDAYEQHLLFCPPCLRQNDKAGLALAALAVAAEKSPPVGLVEHLIGLVAVSGEGR